jgi:hypothetical protein
MTIELADGRYEIRTNDGSRLLTDAGGAVVIVARGDFPAPQQTWEIKSAGTGQVTIRCVGTSNHLAMTETDGIYYNSGGDAVTWRIEDGPKRWGGYDLVREVNGARNALWANGLLISPTAAALQGVCLDPVPMTWSIEPVKS